MSSKLILFRKDGACSFVPHTLLNELNIPHEATILKFDNWVMEAADGSFTHEEYKKIHPTGLVPALRVEDQIITELPAVITYIAELKPERQLLGTTLFERAKLLELMVWLSETLHGQGYGALWRSLRFTDSEDEAIHQAIREKGRKTIMDSYDQIEHLLDGPHAIGRRFTVVDITLYVFWRWGALRIGIDQKDFERRYPKFSDLARGVESMDSVKKTLSEEHQPLAFQA